MNKLNTGKASVFVLTASFVVASFLLGKSFTSISAQVDKVSWCHCEPSGGCQTLNLPLAALQNAGHVGAEGNPLHENDNAGACVEEIVDLCTNIDGNQASVPEGSYHTEEGECLEKTEVCGDEEYENFGGQDGDFDEETEVANDELCSNDPVVDVCPNLDGDQDTLPEGYEYDEQRNCVQIQPTPTPSNGDVCLNIDGIQTSVPSDLHLGADGTSCVSFSVPGVPESPAVGGQVLGASTMASAGSFAESLYMAIMGLGGTLSTAGFVLSKKLSKKA
jgi:hypothetical protein